MKATAVPLLLAVAASLAACGTLYSTPAPDRPPIPATFPHASPVIHPAPLDGWWCAFHDEDLDALVEKVLARNNTLAAAALHLKAAQLEVHLATTNPAVSASYGYAETTLLSGGGPSAQGQTMVATVSYDLDLWGALAAARDVTVWEARASAQDRDSTAIALIAAAVSDYYQIAALNEWLAYSDQDLTSARKVLSLTEALYAAGAASALELANARAALEAQLTSHASLEEQRVEARHGLGVLLDDDDWPPSRERGVLPRGPLPTVEAGLPASVLARRPDLRAAEMRLRESLASVEQTRRSYYPDLTLSGSVGSSSTTLASLLANPIGTLSATLALPFLQADHAVFATQAARVNYQAAARTFRQTLRQAFVDVDNALSARVQLQAQVEALERALAEAASSENLEAALYHAGAVPLQSLLNAQSSRRAADRSMSTARLQALQNYVTLCLALGGGPTTSSAAKAL